MNSVSDKPHEIIGAGSPSITIIRDNMKFAMKPDATTQESIKKFLDSSEWKVIEFGIRGKGETP